MSVSTSKSVSHFNTKLYEQSNTFDVCSERSKQRDIFLSGF